MTAFEYRVWLDFAEVTECARNAAAFHGKPFRVLPAKLGWTIPGYKSEENEEGYDYGQPIKRARQIAYLRNKLSSLEDPVEVRCVLEHPALTTPDKWTLESGDPLPYTDVLKSAC